MIIYHLFISLVLCLWVLCHHKVDELDRILFFREITDNGSGSIDGCEYQKDIVIPMCGKLDCPTVTNDRLEGHKLIHYVFEQEVFEFRGF